MTGSEAKQIWEKVAEPARREGAKARDGEPGAMFRYAGAVETLGAVRLSLLIAVIREEDGKLSEITTEFLAMQKTVEKGAYR